MQKTLQQILNDLGAYIDQDTALPTGTELTVRVNLVDQALQEWGEAYQWKALTVLYNISFAYSGTSIALPDNFKKTMSPIYDVAKNVSKDREYPEILTDKRFWETSTDKYFYIAGDDLTGKYIQLNPAMPSGFSGMLDYQSFPSSMVTLADICVCPQPDYITKRVSALILESRSDTRFPELKADADLVLRRMVEEEQAVSGGRQNRIRDWASWDGFSIGRD